jgi:hypothetical protein
MAVFDITKPGARAIRCGMGGGWIVPLTDEARDVLTDYYGEPPADLAPVCAVGWIVEPQDSAELCNVLRSAGIAWEVIQ